MIDVSQFQGAINWPIVPPGRVLVRVTMGSSGVDQEAVQNIHGTELKKFIMGGYHFLENSDPAVQIQHFLSVWHPIAGGLRGMIDVERSPFSTPTHTGVLLAVEQYLKETGHYPILYGNSGDLANLKLPDWIAKCPLMLADYGPNDGTEHPLSVGVPAPWTKLAVHQYTSVSHIPGISQNTTDLSHVLDTGALAVPVPRPFVDKWRVSYVRKNGNRTRKFTRVPTAFQASRPRAKFRGAIYVHPHRKER